ncbi:unnamed protein product [Acanthoscelides obtectus]|uniref:Uncharacterized protein n=1 Tax=Acanthoscelides obtectus TaxID=200917 RepID=A0A9P0JN34_ACAOB|nr:unnamed protein product [Acanthoscelides obtectus]CAK1621174.1 hypothetical protein AOBTE_LOCUS810 [Acanthoscelides obtectus]
MVWKNAGGHATTPSKTRNLLFLFPSAQINLYNFWHYYKLLVIRK